VFSVFSYILDWINSKQHETDNRHPDFMGVKKIALRNGFPLISVFEGGV